MNDDNNEEQDKNEIIIDEDNYKIGDYICLEDKLTDDKILIGEITKITNKYIEISDSRIPIVRNNMDINQLILLYKKISKNDLINQLGMEMLNIYKNSDNVYMIYEKYIKNPYSNKLINNIYSRLQEYKKTPITTQISTDTTEYDMEINELSQEISYILDNLSDKSLHLSELDLSPELGDESDQSVKKMPIREPSSETFNHLKEQYTELINKYIKTLSYKIEPNIDLPPLFKNIKNKYKVEEEKTEEEQKNTRDIFEYLFYNECSLKPNELSIEDEIYYQDLYSNITQNMKPIVKKIKTEKIITPYILYIDEIKKSLEEFKNEKSKNEDEEEESEKTDTKNIKDKIENYKSQKGFDIINEDLKKIINNELEIIEKIWYLTETIRIKNYDIQQIEIKLIKECIKDNEVFTGDIKKTDRLFNPTLFNNIKLDIEDKKNKKDKKDKKEKKKKNKKDKKEK